MPVGRAADRVEFALASLRRNGYIALGLRW